MPALAPPRDRPIRVRTREEGLWINVRWDEQAGRFAVIDGDGSWVEADEVEAWEPVPLPSIGVGQPRA